MPRTCSIAVVAIARNPSSPTLLIGCGMMANRYPEKPNTRAINSAALTNRVVITPTAGTPKRSAVTASCKLHDEQLPQSPIPEMTASQPLISSMIHASAGAL